MACKQHKNECKNNKNGCKYHTMACYHNIKACKKEKKRRRRLCKRPANKVQVRKLTLAWSNVQVKTIPGYSPLGEKEKKISPKKNTVYINFLPLSSKSP